MKSKLSMLKKVFKQWPVLKISVIFLPIFAILLFLATFSSNDNNKPSYLAPAAQTEPVIENGIYDFTGNYNLPTDIKTYDDKDILISGGTFTIAGEHTFNSLKIINGAKLTHAAFSQNENINTSDKKVSLIITTDLTLDNGGQIDVTGRGYSGGAQAASGSGVGPGTGVTLNTYKNQYVSAGGGAFRGDGGGGNIGTSGNGGFKYVQSVKAPEILEAGSGGGGAETKIGGKYYGSAGGSGGGRVYLDVKQNIRILSKSSGILANGQNGTRPNAYQDAIYTGGGAGGSVWIKADKFLYPYGDMLSVSVIAGQGGKGPKAGTKNTAGLSLYNVYARGGNSSYGSDVSMRYGGGGGGGDIHIAANSVGKICIFLTSSDNKIPAECENQDVVIASGKINMDAVRVWQNDTNVNECTFVGGLGIASNCNFRPGWAKRDVLHRRYELCSADPDSSYSDQSNCNSKRTFKSLTIRNNAVLTHNAITVPDMSQDINPPGGDKSLADETTGTARWKKVDLEVTGNIILENGGINVDGKGYPGGQSQEQNGYGPGGGTYAYYRDNEDHSIFSASGGHSGRGGRGYIDRQPWASGDPIPDHRVTPHGGINGGSQYNRDANNPLFEFGSGGGDTWVRNDGYSNLLGHHATQVHLVGGAGGGRVRIISDGILKGTGGSYVTANGGNGKYDEQTDAKCRSEGWSGAGAGGTIWITAVGTGGLGKNNVDVGALSHHPYFSIPPEKNMFSAATSGLKNSDINNFGLDLNAKGGNGLMGDDSKQGIGGGGGMIFTRTGTLNVTVQNSQGNPVVSELKIYHKTAPAISLITQRTDPSGFFTFYLPPNKESDLDDRYIVSADPKTFGYSQKKTVTIDDALLWNQTINVIIIIDPDPSYIEGDVYGKDNVNTQGYRATDNSVVAAGKTITDKNKVCEHDGFCRTLDTYDINWTKFSNQMDKNIEELKKRAKKYVLGIPYYGNWYLNSTNPNPHNSSPDIQNPEGGVWYIVKPDESPQDLTIGSSLHPDMTYYNRGTIIVSGNLKINGNITAANGGDIKNNQLGFIVSGEVTISPRVNTLQAAIYANGITIANKTASLLFSSPLNFTGFLVSKNNITLPNIGAGSRLTYNSFEDPVSRKPLPGFSDVLSILLSNEAP